MFGIELKDLKDLENKLGVISERAIPFATKSTVNGAAFRAQKEARGIITDKMINRNKWTVKSVRVEQTRTLKIREQEAFVGSIEDYMVDQEFGGVIHKTGKEGVPIATNYSAGAGRSKSPRRRLPRKQHKLQNIMLRKLKTSKMSKSQELVVKMQLAVQSGRRYFFHDFGGGRKKGIFRAVGGSKRIKRGWPKGAIVEMVADLTESSINIDATPWLNPATERATKAMPKMYEESLNFQLKRLGAK